MDVWGLSMGAEPRGREFRLRSLEPGVMGTFGAPRYAMPLAK